MTRTVRTALLAIFLTAIGVTIFLHKVLALNIPLLPNQTVQSWYVEAKIAVQSGSSLAASDEATALPNKVQVRLPLPSGRFAIFQEDFENDGFDRNPVSPQAPSNRLIEFTQQSNETVANVLLYRAIIDERLGQNTQTADDISTVGRRLVSQQFDRFDGRQAQDNLEENLPSEEIRSLLSEAGQNVDDSLALARNLYRLTLQNSDLRVQAVQKTLGSELSAAELTAFLLQRGEIEARVGNGLLLTEEEAFASDFVHWFEVLQDNTWRAYDPVTDRFGPQERYLTWWYGRTPPVSVQGGDGQVSLDVLVRPNTDSGLSQAIWRDRAEVSPLVDYSLLRLPLSTQRVFQVLVLIPIGALIVSLLHQIIGIKTFGTFTPVLIALSFRETGLWIGIVSFVLIVALGLSIRNYLNRLQLLIVPRLSAILTATVLIIIGLAVLLDALQIQLGLSISLFPIVILAMTIERAALMWEEEGLMAVAIAGLGSIAVATVGFLFMTNAYIEHLAFTFPELLLPVLALNLMVGRYNGYKLSEYLRFRAMRQQLS